MKPIDIKMLPKSSTQTNIEHNSHIQPLFITSVSMNEYDFNHIF